MADVFSMKLTECDIREEITEYYEEVLYDDHQLIVTEDELARVADVIAKRMSHEVAPNFTSFEIWFFEHMSRTYDMMLECLNEAMTKFIRQNIKEMVEKNQIIGKAVE